MSMRVKCRMRAFVKRTLFKSNQKPKAKSQKKVQEQYPSELAPALPWLISEVCMITEHPQMQQSIPST